MVWAPIFVSWGRTVPYHNWQTLVSCCHGNNVSLHRRLPRPPRHVANSVISAPEIRLRRWFGQGRQEGGLNPHDKCLGDKSRAEIWPCVGRTKKTLISFIVCKRTTIPTFMTWVFPAASASKPRRVSSVISKRLKLPQIASGSAFVLRQRMFAVYFFNQACNHDYTHTHTYIYAPQSQPISHSCLITDIHRLPIHRIHRLNFVLTISWRSSQTYVLFSRSSCEFCLSTVG